MSSTTPDDTLRLEFDRFDNDKSGAIDEDEFHALVRSLGVAFSAEQTATAFSPSTPTETGASTSSNSRSGGRAGVSADFSGRSVARDGAALRLRFGGASDRRRFAGRATGDGLVFVLHA